MGRVAEALGLSLPPGVDGELPLRAISTDTRTLRPGDLFVALRGESHDAHHFLERATEVGAGAVVVSDARAAAGLAPPALVVEDTLRALGALGRYRRRAWGGPLVAVAGSNGKTSTKELLAAALASRWRVHATSGNFNNQVGVPLTLLAIPEDAEVAVVEVGTNAPGEVALLRELCEPQVALVTSIGEEHLEGLHDLEGVLREESSIFEGAELAVVPAIQPEVGRAAARLARRVVSAGLEEGDLHADGWELLPDGTGRLTVRGVAVHVPLRGVHNMRNAMLALAAAEAMGVPLPDAARGLANVVQPAMRTAWMEMGTSVVLNDAYNANPPSIRAAIELVMAASGGRPTVAVLGTMRELGPLTEKLHREVARTALAAPLRVIAGVGLFADALVAEAPDDPRVVTAPDVEELWPLLRPRLAPDALILLKGSRGARLERLIPYLSDWASS